MRISSKVVTFMFVGAVVAVSLSVPVPTVPGVPVPVPNVAAPAR